MFYRPLTALGLAGLLVLGCVSLSKAQDANGQCVAKDQVIAKVMTESGEGTYFRKVTGGGAEALGKEMADNGLSDVGKSYVVFWKDGEKANAALIAIFDEHNCFARLVKGPKVDVLKITAETGA